MKKIGIAEFSFAFYRCNKFVRGINFHEKKIKIKIRNFNGVISDVFPSRFHIMYVLNLSFHSSLFIDL